MIAWRQNAPARAYIAPPEPELASNPWQGVKLPEVRSYGVFVKAFPDTAIGAIKLAVSARYGLSISDLIGRSQTFAIAHPRQLAMYLAVRRSERPLSVVGRAFGGRDHSTVHHAIAAVEARLKRDPALCAAHNAIVEALGE